MAEIKFSVLSRSCLRQRIPDQETLRRRGRLNAGLDRSATPVKKMASQMAPAPTPQATRGRCLLGRRPSMPTAGPTGGAGRRTVQSGLPHTAGTGDALSDTLPVRLPHILPDRPDNATCKEVPGGHDLRLGDRDHLPPESPSREPRIWKSSKLWHSPDSEYTNTISKARSLYCAVAKRRRRGGRSIMSLA